MTRLRNGTGRLQDPSNPKCASSSHRYKPVSCYIIDALHLSSDSYTPTNYLPRRHTNTPSHTHTEPHPCSQQPHPGSPTRRNHQCQQPTLAAPKRLLLSVLPGRRDVFPALILPSQKKRVEAPSTLCLRLNWNLTLFILIACLPTCMFQQTVKPIRKSCVSFY